jgi:MEDS: MEthanogen/methylotroph, DcmR Sensory domain
METGDRPRQFDGGTLGQHRHICAFFNSIDEQHRVLRSFVTDGFDQRDKAFHLVDPERRDEHLKWLTETGVNLHDAMSAGQLEVW